MKTEELLAEIKDLPVEERAKIADCILNTLNKPNPNIDARWMEEVEQKAKQIESGEEEMISGDEVMDELKKITGE